MKNNIKIDKKSTHIYHKLFITYTTALVLIVTILQSYFITSIKNQIRDTQLTYNKMLCENAYETLEKFAETADEIYYDLYENKMILSDVIWFLEEDLENYFQKRFDLYSTLESEVYQGITYFVEESLRRNASLDKISFVSYKSNKMTSYYQQSSVRNTTITSVELENLNYSVFVAEGQITFLKEIRDLTTYQSSGCLLLSFNNKEFLKKYEPYDKSNLLIISEEKDLIFYSEERNPLYSFLQSSDTIPKMDLLEKQLNLYIDHIRGYNIIIFSYISKSETGTIPFYSFITIICIGIFLFLVGEFLLYIKLKHLVERLEHLLSGMKQVMDGDLTVYLETKQEDELDMIAHNFNIMCKNLDVYIQKSYMAEIEQKNAEMSALQSQINPHFLYNTLEAIRMKAICNGDREVGKMLYGLAVLFRSQLKEDNIITIAKELHYCKKYLELFEFRYQDKFHFTITCSDQYMTIPIIKFVIQPIIENYFVHGIQLETNENYLEIIISKQQEQLSIQVNDNGKGMTKEQIEEKERQMEEKGGFSGSIGILNVHRRIVAVYGKDYGITLKRRNPHGLSVILTLPIKEEIK